ncbi:MAG TPA: DUF4912 domain-containing protein [Nitrospirota bacterium]|nr:DUF4912 domain-containing protein [Nitrospirota bacterium]
MKKTELLSLVVQELKALAKKMKIAVPAKAKKAEIVALLLAASPRKKSASRSEKPAARKTAKRKAVAGKAASIKAKSKKRAGAQAKTATAAKTASAKKRSERITPVHDWKKPPREEEPHLAQERVSDAKYYTGSEQQQAGSGHAELPASYGEDRIVLMTRDPFVAHAYWEATPARIERERSWFGWDSKLAIRIYDVTGVQFDGRNAIGYYDQEVPDRMGNWYFDLGRPSHSFCADMGLLSPEGRFITIARSNFVTMPRDGVSDVIDEEWMLVDEEFWKLYGYPDGMRGVSSPGMRESEILRRKRTQEITSPGLFSSERAKPKRK